MSRENENELVVYNIKALHDLKAVGILDLLHKLYDKVVITTQALQEYKSQYSETPPEWIKVVEVKNKIEAKIKAGTYGISGGSAFVYGTEHRGITFLVDYAYPSFDYLDIYNWDTENLFGVIKDAVKEKFIEEVEAGRLLSELKELSLWMTENDVREYKFVLSDFKIEYEREAYKPVKEVEGQTTKTKLVLWTNWERANIAIERGECKDLQYTLEGEDFKAVRRCIVEYLLVHQDMIEGITDGEEYVRNGHYHQGADDGAPVVEYKGTLYVYEASLRRWGDVMAEVMSVIDDVPYAPID
jgi:predicted nucleic acid-binding protein